MSQPVFEARYFLTVDDFIASQRHGYWRIFRWLVLGIVLMLLVGIYEVAIKGEYDSFALIWSAFMGLYILFFFQFFLPRRARRLFAESKSMQIEQCIQFSDGQVEITSSHGSFRLAWPDVHKWNEAQGLFMIYPNSAMQVLVPAAQIDAAALTYAKARLAEAGLPLAGKPRRT